MAFLSKVRQSLQIPKPSYNPLFIFDHFQCLSTPRMPLKNSGAEIQPPLLTLIRLTSERPCQDWGGLRKPPLLSWLWSKFLLKNHVSLKAGINSNSFGPFLEIFFKNHQKNWRKLKIHQKMAKYEQNF